MKMEWDAWMDRAMGEDIDWLFHAEWDIMAFLLFAFAFGCSIATYYITGRWWIKGSFIIYGMAWEVLTKKGRRA